MCLRRDDLHREWVGLTALTVVVGLCPWGAAPDWYGAGLRPFGPPQMALVAHESLKDDGSAVGADYISLGQRPRKDVNPNAGKG
jgi:hypothetical protein